MIVSAFGVSLIICLISLHKKYGINYETTFKESTNVICGGILMAIVLLILRFIIPQSVSIRALNILIIAVYTIVGAFVYFVFTWKTGTIKAVFGEEMVNKILTKFKLNKIVYKK